MSALSMPFALAVMLLTEPPASLDEAARAAAEAKAVAQAEAGEAEKPPQATIRCRSTDFDRAEGVVMFEGDVVVTYSDGSSMGADRLFMFLSKSNELSRVVALGHVVVTNAQRSGACAMATYRRRRGEIEMFGDGKGALARLVDGGEDASVLEGERIKFWVDAEQVEVDCSRISVEQRKGAAGT